MGRLQSGSARPVLGATHGMCQAPPQTVAGGRGPHLSALESLRKHAPVRRDEHAPGVGVRGRKAC